MLPVLVVASIRFQRQSNAAYLDVRERVGHNLGTLQEGIAGVRVIQAYHRQQEQTRRFHESNQALYRSNMRTVKISTWYFGLVEASGVFALALVIGVGGWLVHRDAVTVGTVTAFVLWLANLFDPVQQLSQLYNTVQSATAALNKLYDLVDTVPDVAEHAHPVVLPAAGTLVADDVTFTYAGAERPALVPPVAHRAARRTARARRPHRRRQEHRRQAPRPAVRPDHRYRHLRRC